jgi:hypothetical protein
MDRHQTPSNDQIMFQYLGAAVLLCWNELPQRTRSQILARANDAVGIVQVPAVREQIAFFLTRRTRATES